MGALWALVRAIIIVVPVWVWLLAVLGAVRAKPRGDMALWLLPAVITALVPALLAYAEPRAMLMLAPVACILAGGATAHIAGLLEQRSSSPHVGRAVMAAVVVLLLIPTVRDVAGAWAQQTPLQQVATARRLVGEYLGRHLPPDAPLVSWHPAIAIYARREWRVLPYESFERIVRYARAQGAPTIVFSRFDPSPLRNPPRAFTAVLVDSSSSPGPAVRFEPVDQTPQLFVGRLAPAATPP